MKNLTLCFAFFCSFSALFSQGNKIISLPLTLEDGFGPFFPPSHILHQKPTNPDNTWTQCNVKVTGIPDWEDVKTGQEWVDAYQFVYQNYHQGNIPEETYKGLQASWKWKPDTLLLSKKPIHSYFCFAFGKKEGQNMFVFDANGNLDFSDDEPFSILDTVRWGNRKRVDNIKVHPIKVEVYDNQKVVSKNLNIHVALDTAENLLLGTEAHYLKAIFKEDGFETTLVGHRLRNLAKNAESVYFIEWQDSMKNFRVFDENMTKQGGFIHLSNDKHYHINGINPKTGNLEMEEVKATKRIESSQIGFIAPDFKAKELLSDKKISLADYKGKYVMLDFWGTWCKPCVQEIPNIKKLRAAFGEDKLVIISVACNENSEDYIKKFINSKEMNWLHILDEKEKLENLYNITSFPTPILIDPNGKILQMSFRGEKMVEYLRTLIK